MSLELYSAFNCCPVFLGKELKEEYYKGAPPIVSNSSSLVP